SKPRNSFTPEAGPSTSANTPSTSLPTHPASPSRVASENTKGRKPTPCTTPPLPPPASQPPPAPHRPRSRGRIRRPRVTKGLDRVDVTQWNAVTIPPRPPASQVVDLSQLER